MDSTRDAAATSTASPPRDAVVTPTTSPPAQGNTANIELSSSLANLGLSGATTSPLTTVPELGVVVPATELVSGAAAAGIVDNSPAPVTSLLSPATGGSVTGDIAVSSAVFPRRHSCANGGRGCHGVGRAYSSSRHLNSLRGGGGRRRRRNFGGGALLDSLPRHEGATPKHGRRRPPFA